MFYTSLGCRYLQVTTLICLILSSAHAFDGRDVAFEPRESDGVPSRRMVPAQVNSPLKSRSTERLLRYEHELHYLEGNHCISLVLHKTPYCFELSCYSMGWHQ